MRVDFGGRLRVLFGRLDFGPSGGERALGGGLAVGGIAEERRAVVEQLWPAAGRTSPQRCSHEEAPQPPKARRLVSDEQRLCSM